MSATKEAVVKLILDLNKTKKELIVALCIAHNEYLANHATKHAPYNVDDNKPWLIKALRLFRLSNEPLLFDAFVRKYHPDAVKTLNNVNDELAELNKLYDIL